ncbi:MAG: immunoglobulin domain-containing protein [Verrucomicrobiia bacterium]
MPFNGATGIPVADGNVVYASFLLNVQTLPSANMRIAYMHNEAASQAGIEAVISSTGQVGIQKKGSGTTFVSGTPVASNGTHLVVMRYTFQSGNDEVAVWVDPDSSSYGVNPAPTTGLYAHTTGGGSDMANPIQYFCIESAALPGPVFWIDEVYVGTTWADVTPSGAPTPPSIDLDPQDQTVVVGDDAQFNVQASGTLPLFYQWYTNTDTVLTGDTNSTLTVANAGTLDAGAYSVAVSNAYGSVTSAVAQLTVNLPVAPSISTQPQDQINVLPGANATFTVVAGGSAPLSYQWYYNTNTPVANATDSILTITNVQPSDAGSYSVVVSNVAGTATSSNAVLTVSTNGVAPVFTTMPASQVILAGGTASFTVVAVGTAPISYQWNKDGVAIPGQTSSTLTLTNVQVAADGNYTATASNSVGVTTSDPGQLTVTTSVFVPNSAYNLTGFAHGATGGGVIATNDPAYRQVFTALDFANAILSANKTAGSVKVIEIMNELDLGWNEIDTAVQNLSSTPFRSHNPPQLHPVLLVKGMSLCDIKPKSGLTIFSANGATIKHCNFNVKGCTNIIIRNLKFDENWEWDEATKGQYDKNDWDFITIGNGGAVSNIWIDHCTFTKSYDGIVDTKHGCSALTFSWCKYTGDDGATNPNSWVWQQINALESNKSSYAFYNFLRSNGFSTTDIVTVVQGHDKTHLAGSNDLDPQNATLSMTFHHLWLINVWDRCVPRLRAGNVHDYNLYVDDTLLLAAKNLRNARAAAMTTANQNTLNNTYSINPPMNGAISTENGALLVEKSVYLECLTPLRNNQTDPSNPAYTGKIMALDTIYQKNGVVSPPGNSTDPGSLLGPFQATIIPFSWNLTGNQLPYTYTMDDPSQLQAIITSPTGGAGAGVLTWNKTNWMVTAYPPSAPVITGDPQSVIATNGQSVQFTVVAGGSNPLSYQWYFNTSSPVGSATNATLTITSVQSTNVGSYSVVVSNGAGTATSANATLTLMVSPVAGFTASPINGAEPLAVTFTDESTGSPLPSLSWDFGDNTTTNTASGASFAHTYAAGTYTVTLTASNSAGTSTLVSNSLITATVVATNAFQSWQLSHFGCTNCAQADAAADPDGDGMNNLAEFLSGSDPNNSSSGLRIISVAPQNNGDMLITWSTVGGLTNAVQATAGDAGGGYSTNFVDITTRPHIIVSGSGDVTTNYTDSGGATNPSRFYRIRLVP